MKTAAFSLVVPTSIEGAVDALVAAGADARLLAGGQSLMPLMAARVVSPGVVVDLAGVPGLDEIRLDNGWLVIGGMVRQRAVERSALVVEHAPLLGLAVRHIAHATIRNQGTVGGSLAHADPTAEIPVVALALDAVVGVVGPDGRRELPVAELFVGPNRTVLGLGDVLVDVRVPVAAAGTRVAFEELSRRRGDVALASAALTIHIDGSGVIDQARIALGSVAATPVRAGDAESLVLGQEADDVDVAAVSAAATGDLHPPDDVHATGAYRRHLAGVLVRRALTAVLERSA